MGLAALAYAGAAAYARFNDPVRTAAAEACIWRDTLELTGVVIRSEQLLDADAAQVRIDRAEGERVAAGEALGVYRTSGETYFRGWLLLRLRDELEAAETASPRALGGRADALRAALSAGDHDGAVLAAAALRAGVFGADANAAAALRAQIGALEAAGAGDAVLAAPASGFFLRGTDGWEGLSPAEADTLSAEGLEAVLRRGPSPTTAAGRLVTGSGWCFAALTNSAAAERFTPGETVSLTLGGRRVDAEVDRVTILREKSVVVFTCSEALDGVLSLRAATAEAELGRLEGLLLPAGSLREDEEGIYVYRAAGPIVRREPVSVLARREEGVLVAGEGLRAGSLVLLGGDWAEGMLIE